MASLDPNTIASLIRQAPAPIKQAVNDKVKESLDILRAKLDKPDLLYPRVVYDLKGSTAGQAVGSETIRLNLDLLLDPATRNQMLNQTVPHEVTHIVQMQFWPNSKSHGYEWQRLMLMLGLPPDRTHSMATKPARKRQPQARYAYFCGCPNRTHFISQTRHNKIQRGTQHYKCKYCRKEIYPDYGRQDNT